MATDATLRSEPVLDRFVRATREYEQQLAELMGEWQRRFTEAQQLFARAYAEAFSPREVQQKAADAVSAYGQAVREAASPEDLQRRIAEALNAYRQMLAEQVTPDQVRLRLAKAYADYVSRLREALGPEQAQESVDRSYREYVHALQQAWSQVDPDRLEPSTLSSIMQTLAAAAWVKSVAAAAVRERWAAAPSLIAATIAARLAAPA